MLTLHDRGVRLCDGLNRREWLRVGSVGLGGLSLADLLAARQVQAAPSALPASSGRAKSCIVLFLLGGPPQHETWDPKPDAPEEVRGQSKPIATRTPGLFVGEMMPRVAQLTDKICVLRAMSTRDNAHSSSGYWMLTGYPHTPMNSENAKPGAPNDWPCAAAVVQRLRGARAAGSLPPAIRLPEEIWNTGRVVWPGQDAGFLGRTADPWLLACDPNEADFGVPGVTLPSELPPLRLQQRRTLLEQLNQHLEHNASGVDRWNTLSQQAFGAIHSGRGREAFDLGREGAAARDRYGRNRFGQSVLLARRLVEAGVSLVQVNWTRWATDTAESPAWDTHRQNHERLQKHLMPAMDQAYSALLEDLTARGLLDETLVVWMGEFGRTPKINRFGGRDHWGNVFSVALAGGGVRGGQVLGRSDELGGYPKEGVVAPHDLTATIFHALGYHADTMIHDRLNRPMPISKGQVIAGVF